jgi:photosystem II stability/assembly factor-like uncharacterized protein
MKAKSTMKAWAFLAATLALLMWVGSAAAAAGPHKPPAAAPAHLVAGQAPTRLTGTDTINMEGETPNWGWHAIMASPRIGLDLRAIDVDPTDPNHIVVGTEEGTVQRSFDGGVTWAETELHPFILKRAPPPPEPPKGEPRDPTEQQSPAVIAWSMLPFNLWPPSQVLKPPMKRQESLFRGDLWIFAWGTRQGETLLREVTEGIVKPRSPVHRILSCPGSEYSLIAAAEHNLFGSADGGETFVRLFGLPDENDQVTSAACSTEHPGEIVASTTKGVYFSKDGGATFDPLLYGIPGTGSRFVAYAPRGKTQTNTIYSAEGSTVWIIDMDAPAKAKRSYPFAVSPFNEIRWMATSREGAIWLATDRGIRLSEDGGKNWISVAPDQFESFDWWQVAVGPNEKGGERVVILREHFAYASDDGGRNWYVWFSGGTKRDLRRIAASAPATPGGSPRWWLLSRQELWSTQVAAPGTATMRITRGAPQWAARRLAQIPPLSVLLAAANDRAGLDDAHVSDILDRMHTRSWLPRVYLTIAVEAIPRGANNQTFIATRSNGFLAGLDNSWAVRLDFRFFLTDLTYPTNGSPPATEKTLYILRQRMNYALEDAYWERGLRLHQLADGGLDDLQTFVVRSRVDTLDAMIGALTRSDFYSNEPGEGQ